MGVKLIILLWLHGITRERCEEGCTQMSQEVNLEVFNPRVMAHPYSPFWGPWDLKDGPGFQTQCNALHWV